MSDCVKGVEESVISFGCVVVEIPSRKEGEIGVLVWSVDDEGGRITVKGASCDEKQEGAKRSANIQLMPHLELVGKDGNPRKIARKGKEMTGARLMEGDVSTKAQVFSASRGAMNVKGGSSKLGK